MKILMVFPVKEEHLTAWRAQQHESVTALGVEVVKYYFVDRKSIFRLIKEGLNIRKIALLREVELIHVEWGSSCAFFTTLFSPVPVVVKFYGSDLYGNYNERGKKTVSGRISVLFSHLSALLAKRCIAVSNELKKKIMKPLRYKCHVVPLGVDINRFFPMSRIVARKKLKWEENRPVVIYFCGVAWVKDPRLAFRVIEIAKTAMPEIEFHVIKDQPFEEMFFYYNGADAMLMTSIHEGSNSSLKEAMACNLPIVSTDVGDAKERLNNVATSFVCSRNPHELAEKLCVILKECRRSNGREFVREVGLENVTERIIKIYSQILAKN
ncbi:glycosyltransferase family 4 protein [Thermodesulfobacteriota bacterium]